MDVAANVDVAAFCAVIGAVGGLLVPQLVGRLPEPVKDTVPVVADGTPESEPEDDPKPKPDPKPLYADLAAHPGLAWKCALWSAGLAGVIGLSTGWIWPLLYLLYLVPVGVALGYVDYRTRLLPTRIIAPSYVVVGVLLLVCFAIERHADDLLRAGLGWLLSGFVFWFLWRFTPGMGYGDVRLSGVLGMALGYLGWGELLIGMYAGFLVGAVGWIPLRLLGITKDRHFPFGPFMLLGTVVGIVWGGPILAGLG
jgi:leader peptidase (prepilin peptidase)/N-methyltransferase